MFKRLFVSLLGLNLVAGLLTFSATVYSATDQSGDALPKILIYGDSLSAA